MPTFAATLVLAILSATAVDAARVQQPSGQQSPLLQAKVAASGFQGRFATGGPHSQRGHQAPVAIAPKVSNKAHLVRPGRRKDLDNALERPYEALFGHPGVNKKNYRNAVYDTLDKFDSTVLDA